MKLAFGIYKYFPYSGLALDMVRIAKECLRRGHKVCIFTQQWQGDEPEGIEVIIHKTSALSNHANAAEFHQRFIESVKRDDFDLSVGFNKIPGVDYYFCGDFCYLEHSINKNSFLYQYTSRYKTFKRFEQGVFEQESQTKILSLSSREDTVFKKHYSTPTERFVSLPSMLEKTQWVDNTSLPSRAEIRASLGIKDHQSLMLFVGSDFARKGLDRALHALASLSKETLANVVLCVAGQGKVEKHQKMVDRLGISNNVQILGPRKDVPALMKAGDFLIHPARAELAGGVIVEAIVSGLGVIVTEVCGYAWHVNEADAGIVLEGEFSQEKLNQAVDQALTCEDKDKWRQNGFEYSKKSSLYAMAKVAVDEFENNCIDKINLERSSSAVSSERQSWMDNAVGQKVSFTKFMLWLKGGDVELDELTQKMQESENAKQSLDQLITRSNGIKNDQTTTVVSIAGEPHGCIIKRYNARNYYHFLSRSVRKSRAQRCWSMSYVFNRAGLNVAQPVMAYEQRFGPLRLDAYFVSEELKGQELLSALPNMDGVQQKLVVMAIDDAFNKMLKARIGHRDMKATNLMWVDGSLFFIDLDGSKEYSNDQAALKANRKDKKRFLENWQDQADLLALFDSLL